MEDTKKLIEGEYEIAEGYEYVGRKNGKLIIKKKPDIKEFDIVTDGNGHMGVFRYFTDIETAAYYIDFSYNINHWNKLEVLYLYKDRTHIVAKDIRKVTDEELQIFYDSIHAYGYDYNPETHAISCCYKPKEAKYGVMIIKGDFEAVEVTNENCDSTLGGKWWHKFDTKRATEAYIELLNRKIKN